MSTFLPGLDAETRLRHHAPVFGLSVGEALDHHERALAGPGVERALAGELADLLRHVLAVAVRLGAEHRAAARPVRGAGRALTGAAGALLLPRLLVAAGDPAAGLRGVAVPWRWLARNAFTAWCITGTFTVPSNVLPGSATRRAGCRAPCTRPRRGSWVLPSGSALLADEHDAVGRTGDAAADVDQVALGIDLLDAEVALPCDARRRSGRASSCP
jgi:hypothetical protein